METPYILWVLNSTWISWLYKMLTFIRKLNCEFIVIYSKQLLSCNLNIWYYIYKYTYIYIMIYIYIYHIYIYIYIYNIYIYIYILYIVPVQLSTHSALANCCSSLIHLLLYRSTMMCDFSTNFIEKHCTTYRLLSQHNPSSISSLSESKTIALI